jgi:Neuraminidase (sialidase)
VIKLSAGHLQLAKGSEITNAALSVSFDGGKTWHKATLTGSNGSYAASFNAPADSLVSLRATASDLQGSQITETITNAYQAAFHG